MLSLQDFIHCFCTMNSFDHKMVTVLQRGVDWAERSANSQ